MVAIWDSVVYAKKADRYLPGLYYLVTWKGYLKEENTWEPSSTVMHLRKMVGTFYKDLPEKPTATLAPLDFVLPTAKPTIQIPAKRKREQPIRYAKKHAKWDDKEKSKSVWSQSQMSSGSRRSVSLARRAPGSLYGSWPRTVQLLKNCIAPYSDQVPPRISPSSIHQSRFFLLCP